MIRGHFVNVILAVFFMVIVDRVTHAAYNTVESKIGDDSDLSQVSWFQLCYYILFSGVKRNPHVSGVNASADGWIIVSHRRAESFTKEIIWYENVIL